MADKNLQEVAAKKLRNMSAWLRDYITAIKNGNMHPFTQIERKAREATRNEAWGPTGTRLNQLAEASFVSADCEIIFAVVQLRLGYPPERWRNVYKALVVLEFLLLRGSPQCIQITTEDVLLKLKELSSFAYTSPDGKDQGVNVRYRAKAIMDLVNDKERLQSERQVCQQKKKAYQGYTKNDLALLPAFNDDQALSTPRTQRSASLRRTLSDNSVAEKGDEQDATASGAPKPMKAGETKGVTMEMNRKHLEELRQLLSLPHNKYCADCQGGGGASRASWASINNGTFICFRCAGVHRGLGVHISKVRSCTLDTWLPEQVAFMAATGNHKANTFLEAKLGPDQKPGYDTPQLAQFIRQKYEARAFAAAGVWPPCLSPLKSARSLKRPSENETGTEAQSVAPEGASTLQRKEPRLPGRRSRTGQGDSGAPWPVMRMVSVPLPPPGAVPTAQPSTGPNVPDLMDFSSPTSYSAPAGDLGMQTVDTPFRSNANTEQPSGMSMDSGLAELSSIEIPYDHEASVATYALPPSQPPQAAEPSATPPQAPRVPQLPLHTLSQPSHLPPWHPLRTDSSASSAILTTGAIVFGDGPEGAPGFDSYRSGVIPANEHLQTIDEGATNDFSFQGDSVQEWGQEITPGAPLLAEGRARIKTRKSIGAESDLASNVSTPLFTPRMTGLLGPGPQPTWRRNQISAGLAYNPVASTFKPTSQRVEPVRDLKLAAKQLSSANGGGNSLDELVLHALADVPGFGAKQNQAVANKPTSMIQQKAQVSRHVLV